MDRVIEATEAVFDGLAQLQRMDPQTAAMPELIYQQLKHSSLTAKSAVSITAGRSSIAFASPRACAAPDSRVTRLR